MDQIENILNQFSDNTNLKRYLNSLENLNREENQKKYEEIYLPIIQNEEKQSTPFLSVIIRTQGKREEGLREALLCMQGQSCQDYEIILIAHKASKTQKQLIEEILSDQDPDFREKIRYYELDYGTRTTPLNYGFSRAWGEYAAIFDDDDILFSNWVESFKNSAKANGGRILHSYAFSQNWENIEQLGYRAVSAPEPNYCTPFDLLNQLSVNRCPLMTLAFPVNIFQKVGIIFDEKLNVTEDWEYFMRSAFVCGVSDVCEPAAIYRFWNNIETSATLHDQENWMQTYKEIQESYNNRDIVLPAGNIKRIIELMSDKADMDFSHGKGETLSRLYYGKESGFNSNECISAINKEMYPDIDVWFLFEEKRSDINAMRLDLCREGLFVLKDFSIDIWFTNGEKKVLSIKDCIHNGIEYKDAVFFINPNPEIVWELEDQREVDVVNVKGQLSRKITPLPIINRWASIFPLGKFIKKRRMHSKGYF